MATVNELLEEIKNGCPELSESIDTLKSNIHGKTLSKVIKTKKKDRKIKKDKPIKTQKKRGRPKKNSNNSEDNKPQIKKKRGRPKKNE